ncbi:MAG: hypothetical protein WC216_05550 [Gallionella sp.]|jgi:hypothetical protein
MYVHISGSMHADALHVYFGLVFAALVFTSRGAQSEESFFSSDLELATARFAVSNNDPLQAARLSASVALSRSEDAFADRSWLGSTPRLQVFAGTKQQNNWSTDTPWKLAPENEHVSLIPLLRYESKEDRFVIKPRRHSITVLWQKSFR